MAPQGLRVFTGIIRAIGTVTGVSPGASATRLTIDPGPWDHAPAPGDSIACSGCCLTLSQITDRGWAFDAIPETLDRTTLGTWREGTRVNLERSLRMGDALDGHQVQGHVDAVGKVAGIDETDGWRIRVSVPEDLRRWMIPKGSVAIDGVSLTIAALAKDGSWIECAIIPETLGRTTIRDRAQGERVNLEADILVKTIVATMDRVGAVH